MGDASLWPNHTTIVSMHNQMPPVRSPGYAQRQAAFGCPLISPSGLALLKRRYSLAKYSAVHSHDVRLRIQPLLLLPRQRCEKIGVFKLTKLLSPFVKFFLFFYNSLLVRFHGVSPSLFGRIRQPFVHCGH